MMMTCYQHSSFTEVTHMGTGCGGADRALSIKRKMNNLFCFIDIYPDFFTFAIILASSALQLLIGNSVEAVLLSVSLMLPTLAVTLPVNVLIKCAFKAKRPERYYKSVKGKTVFEGSFPSFHSHFSAGEATTYIAGIALYSPEKVRLIATLLAIITAGLSSVVIAYSRVALKMHHSVDALGGLVLGVATGFVVSYAAVAIWSRIPLIYHIAMIVVFVNAVFLLSEKQRKIRSPALE